MAFAQAYARALAKAVRENPEQAEEMMAAMAEMTEPYGTAAATGRIAGGEADVFDYMAAVPLVGVPARAVKALKSLNDLRPAQLRQMGYPADTAERISSGELPMDRESITARARAQGFDTDETVYRGAPANIVRNQGRTFSTNDPKTASSYVEPLDEYSDASEIPGAVYPMYRRPGMELTIDPGVNPDTGEAFNFDGYEYSPPTWSNIPDDTIPEQVRLNAFPHVGGKPTSGFTTDDVVRGAKKEGYDSVRFMDIDDRGSDNWNQFQESNFNIDPETGEAIETSADVMVDLPGNLRSVNAAFDPNTTDPTNIMAGVTGVGATALIAQLLRQMEEEDDTAL